MRFRLEIKSESDANARRATKHFLDEDQAVKESMKKQCIVAYV